MLGRQRQLALMLAALTCVQATTLSSLNTSTGVGAVAIRTLSAGKPTSLASPDEGFDPPLTRSPDGRHVVVRSFRGDSLGNPGQAGLTLASPEGQRSALVKRLDADPFGWVRG